MIETSAKQDAPNKKIGIFLFFGILLFPLVFTWFLLRKGHSTTARVIGFAWLVVTTLLVTRHDPQPDNAVTAKTEQTASVSLTTPTTSVMPASPLSSAPTVVTQPIKRALPIAKDSAAVAEIEGRLRDNEKYLRKYYGTSAQLNQLQNDLVQLAMLKVEYFDNGNSAEDKALGKKAASLGRSVEVQSRQVYASTLEEAFMKSGMDVKVSAVGANKDQMKVVYALMSQPLIYKFQNEIRLSEKAASFGFRKLVYSNGFESDLGKTWTVDLKE